MQTPHQNKSTLYKKPEFLLVLFTVLLWLAFLSRVLMTDHPLETPTATPVKTPIQGPPETRDPIKQQALRSEIIPQSPQAHSRNKLGTDRIQARKHDKKEQEVIKALRESFARTKPRENLIIRSDNIVDSTPLRTIKNRVQMNSRKTDNTVFTNNNTIKNTNKVTLAIERMLNDHHEMTELNTEYVQALLPFRKHYPENHLKKLQREHHRVKPDI